MITFLRESGSGALLKKEYEHIGGLPPRSGGRGGAVGHGGGYPPQVFVSSRPLGGATPPQCSFHPARWGGYPSLVFASRPPHTSAPMDLPTTIYAFGSFCLMHTCDMLRGSRSCRHALLLSERAACWCLHKIPRQHGQ